MNRYTIGDFVMGIDWANTKDETVAVFVRRTATGVVIVDGELRGMAAECVARLVAERDELQREIMRLPKPPDELGDGPQERVQAILDRVAGSPGETTMSDRAKRKPKDGVEVTIAVPITLFVTREVVGNFLGPIELWRARFSGTFDIQDQTGDSPEEAAWKMAERLKGAFN